ncbi:MAG: prepilin-type N-terminal cleavage/methylation domain-containing protein [Phycisphaerae bacterium]|nr:prepilin-type N-terminal cleavage/methylation domain-containing protein [Phycisphaerae bacterium]
MKIRRLKPAFTPTPIYIGAARLKKTHKTVLAGFQNSQSKCKLVRGFTLVELIICLAISAMVLTAAAIAFDACIANYQVNKDISDAIIKANQVLSRITADLRCAIDVNAPEPNTQCSMFTAGGDDITYRFDQAEGKLYLVKNGTAHILCEGISSAAFEKTPGINELGLQCVKSVQITLTVGSGNSAQKACAAVAIRRNL